MNKDSLKHLVQIHWPVTPIAIAALALVSVVVSSVPLLQIAKRERLLTSQKSRAAGILQATPNPIQVCSPNTTGNTTLSWNTSYTTTELRRGTSSSDPLITSTGPSGQYQSTNTATNTTFGLFSVTNSPQWVYNHSKKRWERITITTRTLIDQTTITHTQEGCSIPPPASSNPLVGAIRWDAWRANNAEFYVSPKLYTDYSHREPFYGWYNIDSQYQSVPNHQQIIDREINYAADNGLDYYSFVWYPENLAPYESITDLMKPYHDYQDSQYKNRLKFSFILQTFWAASGTANDSSGMESRWRTYTVPKYIEYFQDPQYLRVDGGRPVVYWLNGPDLDDPVNGFGDKWQQELQYFENEVIAAGFPAPYIVGMDSEANVRRYGMESVGKYGVADWKRGACYSHTVNSDRNSWGPFSGLTTTLGLAPMGDPRPRIDNGVEYLFWVQPPVYSEWERHFKMGWDWARQNLSSVSNPPLMLIYAWNELDEGGGGIVPGKQDGDMYLSAIKAVKTGQYPGSWTDVYNGDDCAFQFTGNGWVDYFPINPDARPYHDNDEQISTQVGDTVTLTLDKVTRYKVFGTVGLNRDKAEVSIDGVSKGIVDTYRTSWSRQVWFDSGNLPPGTHTLKIMNRGDRPDQKSFGIDKIEVSRVR